VAGLCALGLWAAAALTGRRRAGPGGPVAEDLDQFVEDVAARLPGPLALRELCLAERLRRDGTATARVWAEVAARWDALAQPYPAAYARFRQGEAAMEGGDRAAAVAALRPARAAAAVLRAGPLLAAVDALGAAARLDLTVADRAAAPAPVPFGLTRREQEVVRLLCQGRTNRQIGRALYVTERTAGVHVSNIIAKMQVDNRGQVAALALRHGLCENGVP
jgi:DNA-binding CsgD family transcriptional regulator